MKYLKKQQNEQMMTYTSKELKLLIEQLDKLLFTNRDEGLVIGLQGYWGIGKTFFWNHYIERKEKGDKFVNISLFGLNSVDEIKKKIILKISDRAKVASKLKKYSSVLKYFEIDVSAFISIIDKNDFKDIIICIDDFERISPNLSISEVMGFIVELKEQLNCKVVLINNNDMLKDQDEKNHKKYLKKELEDKKEVFKEAYRILQTNNQEIFDNYSEKIIDVTIWYEPHLEDIIGFVKEKNIQKDYINWELIHKLFDLIKDKNEKFNIRLIKKLVLKLELFEKILENENIDLKIKNGILIELFKNTIKEKVDLNYLDDIAKVKPEYKAIYEIATKKHLLDLDKFQEDVEEYSSWIRQYELQKNISEQANQIYFNYMYGLKYTNEKFYEDMYNLLNTNNIDIVKTVSLKSFLYYLNDFLLKSNTNLEKYKQLLVEKMKFYIKENIYYLDASRDSVLKELFQEYSELEAFYQNEKKNNTKTNDKLSKEKIQDIINTIYKDKGWNPDVEKIIERIDLAKHKEWLEEDRQYFEVVFHFCSWIMGFSGEKPFKNFYNDTLEIYKELAKKEEYGYKMSFLLKHFLLDEKNKDK
ncbi:P-loop NTPase fold protein [Arcobacter vandammei]|uniref:P-loop NTPase fold protein n=2 Tax=Arcobacter vandammei TaxID=2782243 RepID=UPI00211D987A|nr:P-loop NTPase fold protein [Arcobacter vandammei]